MSSDTLLLALLFLLSSICSSFVASQPCSPSISQRHYSRQYSQSDILNNPQKFACDVFYWEGRFHQRGLSYNAVNGMTYDGSYLNPTTGFATTRRNFSAAGNEVHPSSSLGYRHQKASDKVL
jgi:hypothetical protein